MGGEFTLTLSEEPNAISCVGVQVTDDSSFEDVENFAVQLQTPGNEAAIRPGSATQATILIDDAGTSKSSYYAIVILHIYFSGLQQTEKQRFKRFFLLFVCLIHVLRLINEQCKNH